MRAEDLTREQARALKNKLQPMLSYLGRLKERMRRKGFLVDDRLLSAVCRAEDAMHALSVSTFFLIVAIPSVALSLFVAAARQYGVSYFVTAVLEVLDYAILIVDSALCLAYFCSHSWKLIKELMK